MYQAYVNIITIIIPVFIIDMDVVVNVNSQHKGIILNYLDWAYYSIRQSLVYS